MSKLQIAVIEALESGEWMSSSEIATATKYKKSSVRVTLSSLDGVGLILKKDDPARTGYSLYKKSNTPCGFGISQNLSEFQRLISMVRAGNATERQHNVSSM